MDNQKQEKGESKPTADNTDEGSKYETTPVIERAREEREKMETATKAMKEQNDRKEQIMAKEALGGKSEAGQSPKSEAETDEEYTEKFQKGEVNPLETDAEQK